MTDAPVPTPDGTPTARPFATWLLEQRGGTTHAELTAALPELVEAVTTYGKAGTIVLTVKVKPSDGDRGAVIVSDEVTIKKPAGDRAPALFFVDEHSNLVRDNPFAMPMAPLREVPPAPAPAAANTEAKEA